MPDALKQLREYEFPPVDWGKKDLPVAIVDGHVRKVTEIDTPLEVEHVYVVSMKAKHFERFCQLVRPHTLQFNDMRVEDLSPLGQMSGLRQLAIRWNTKVRDLSFLLDLPLLETFVLDDTPKVRDLAPLTSLTGLTALAFSGGIWNKNRAESLEPIGALSKLRELELINIFVEQGGLKPIAACRKLEVMALSNQLPTEDYAYLAAKLPDVECDQLAPYVELDHAIDGKDVMVTGKRKPFLNARKDAERLARYVREFDALKARFRDA